MITEGIWKGAGNMQSEMTVIDLTDENTLRKLEQEEPQAEPPFQFENQLSLFDAMQQ